MKYLLLILLLFGCCGAWAQNLVPNPSFEDTIGCPYDQDQVYLSKGWSSYGESPDYFNACDNGGDYGVPSNAFGYQNAINGNAYCGLFTEGGIEDYREFIGGKLLTQLVPGIKYYVSLKASLCDGSNCATNNLGISFSTVEYSEFTSKAPINNKAMVYSSSIISDTTNWINISGSFISDSAYKYVMVGNFYQDNMTQSTIFQGNSCNAYYYIDDVCVSSDSLGCDLNSTGISNISYPIFNIYPNPASNRVYINVNQVYEIELCSFLGSTLKSFKTNGMSVLDVSEFPSGIYFIRINNNDKIFQQKQIIIH